MSDKKSWQGAVELNPDELTAVKLSDQHTTPPQEFSVEDVQEVTTENEYIHSAETPNSASPQAKSNRALGKLAAGLIGSLLTAAVGLEFYRLIDWGFSIHMVLGYALSLTLLSGLSLSGLWLFRAFKGLRQLEKSDQLRQEAEAMQGTKTHGEAIKLLRKLDSEFKGSVSGQQIHLAIQQLDSSYNDGEMIRYVSQHALSEQDEAARQCIKQHSVKSGLLVAVSPYASLDIWLVGWRNLKLLNELAGIYGISPGAATQWRLLRSVLHNIAFAGLSEISIQASSHLLSTSITSSLSLRASQGIGAGLFTARSGLQAMKLCRPLPLENQNQIKLDSITQSILEQIKTSS